MVVLAAGDLVAHAIHEHEADGRGTVVGLKRPAGVGLDAGRRRRFVEANPLGDDLIYGDVRRAPDRVDPEAT